jgi:RimJ/RimL family protein N-acetyltransferase
MRLCNHHVGMPFRASMSRRDILLISEDADDLITEFLYKASMPKNLMIRRIGLGEADRFKRMRLASLKEAPYAFSSTYDAARLRNDESWREQADSSALGSDRATFFAFADDAPVGIAAVYRLSDKKETGELIQMWVAPEQRGKGVARDLLNAIFRWAGENGFRTVIAKVTNGNDRAQKFYRKYGFVLEGREAPDGSEDAILLCSVTS